MIPCLILGDSLAVGVGQARPECIVAAEVGINSSRYLQIWRPPMQAKTVVISLGVNDSLDIETEQNLRQLRHGITAETVYWLVPGIHPTARTAVHDIARAFGDKVIDVAPLTGSDHVHPDRTGYATLASLTRHDDDGRVPRQGDGGRLSRQGDGGRLSRQGDGGRVPRHSAYATVPSPRSAYRDFPAAGSGYRDFAAAPVHVPGVNVWRGPDNLNGLPVPPMPPKKPPR